MMNDTHSTLRTGLVYDSIYRKHQPGHGHPERPERCDATLEGISSAVPADRILKIKPRKATTDELLLCHTREYITTAYLDIQSGYGCLTTGDTDVSDESFDAALMAAGGAMTAVDAVMSGSARNAFCCIRPPGHHAMSDRGMGFCIFNNVAVAARYAQKKHGIKRAVIADWDVHHGNGTQEIFYEDPSVFYFSTHQWPFYPGSGSTAEKGVGPGKGFNLNCPFPAGSGRTEIIGAFKEQLAPAMRWFKPEFVFISAGFDSREGDLLGHFCLTDKDYADLTGIMMNIAGEYANGRIVSVLEGGYSLPGLASAVGAHVKKLAS